MHAGGPRFGSGKQAVQEMDWLDIEKANIVLPPSMPDFQALEEARKNKGENVRVFGVPAGEDAAQRYEIIEWQVQFGIAGIRLMPHEVKANRKGIDLLGEAGRCLFFINPFQETSWIRFSLEWLKKYPNATIAAPHFLCKGSPKETVNDLGLFRELLSHPRFYVIFSRHGGASSEEYPHQDLRPWVEYVVEKAGWEKLMWGSEFPVLYWRDEQVKDAQSWLDELLADKVSSEMRDAYLQGNAQRIFFEKPAPAIEKTAESAPDWSRKWVENGGWAGPIKVNQLRLSHGAKKKLMAAYLAKPPEERKPYTEFLTDTFNRIIEGS